MPKLASLLTHVTRNTLATAVQACPGTDLSEPIVRGTPVGDLAFGLEQSVPVWSRSSCRLVRALPVVPRRGRERADQAAVEDRIRLLDA